MNNLRELTLNNLFMGYELCQDSMDLQTQIQPLIYYPENNTCMLPYIEHPFRQNYSSSIYPELDVN